MKRNWWKVAAAVLLMYTTIAGFLVQTPVLEKGGLFQTIRNLFYHVPMWFTMTALFFISVYYAIRHLRGFKHDDDLKSAAYAQVGVIFSVLGMLTGMEWANFTWSGQTGRTGPWTGDPKQICAALLMLIYFAYFILRGGIKDEEKRGRIAAVYNIFACAMIFPLIFIIPRLVSSLHPGGSEGNPALNPKDSDPRLLTVLYPAFIGWILLGLWITHLVIRMRRLDHKLNYGPETETESVKRDLPSFS
jgi:heme exporter protein C